MRVSIINNNTKLLNALLCIYTTIFKYNTYATETSEALKGGGGLI